MVGQVHRKLILTSARECLHIEKKAAKKNMNHGSITNCNNNMLEALEV